MNRRRGIWAAFGVVFAIVITSAMFCMSWYKNSETVVTGTVTDKYVKNNRDSASQFYIVIDSGDVYENTDSVTFGKYNSADLQAQVHVGDNVEMHVAGKRNSLWSEFRNVISITKIEDVKG